MKITTDLEGGFVGHPCWQRVTQAGTNLVAIAGMAHWQAGKIERHNQTIKEMLFATIRQTSQIGREDMRKPSWEVAWSKNSMVREHGRAPIALVFGREPRVYHDMHCQSMSRYNCPGNPTSYHPSVGDAGSDAAFCMRFRYHAKLELVRISSPSDAPENSSQQDP